MQIVIEIPDRLIDNEFGYIDIRLHKDEAHVNSITTPDYNDPYYAELQFNVLPKGHGRLIDADAFAKRLKEISEHHHFEKLFRISALAVVLSVVDELTGESLCGYENNPTVIPADKGDAE